MVLYGTANAASKKNNYRYVILGILFYAFFMGVRSGVGGDFYGYLDMYKDALSGSYSDREELGWIWYLKSLAFLNAPQWVYYGLVAFLQLFLVFYSVKKNKEIYPYLALTFMLGGVWLSYANGLRQQLAFCIIAVAITFINDKSLIKGLIKYIVLILLAFLFHRSAIIAIVFFPLFRTKSGYMHNLIVEYGLLVVAFIYSNTDFATMISGRIEEVSMLLNYENYLNPYSEMLSSTVERFGVGYFIELIIIVFLIAISNSVKESFNSKHLNIIYDISFIGFLLKYIFIDSLVFSRINYYFLGFQYIFAAFSLYSLIKSKKQFLFYALLSLYLLIFIATMYRMMDNTAFYQFYWNDTLKFAH